MAGVSFEELSRLYGAERPRYEALAELLGARIEDGLRRNGVEALVQWRAKDVQSFVKKALRKAYADPMREIRDKAGVRVIVHFEADITTVRGIVSDCCDVLGEESKLDALAYNELGYLGVHLDVVMRAPGDSGTTEDVTGLGAEIQIHTKAQSAWAVVSHDLLYKTPQQLPVEIQRGITRLVALVELFDAEITRMRQTVRSAPEFDDLRVLEPLDDELVKFTARRPDRALSAIVVPPLTALFDCAPPDIYETFLRPFVAAHHDEIAATLQAYEADERANPLLFQPEALLLFERLANDPDRLREAWPIDRLPIDLLQSLATIRGVSLDG